MFLAIRDLRFARGRFALIGTVVALIAVLGVILSGLSSGLSNAGISGLRALPVTHFAFEKSATSEQFSRSTVTSSTFGGDGPSSPVSSTLNPSATAWPMPRSPAALSLAGRSTWPSSVSSRVASCPPIRPPAPRWPTAGTAS